MNISLVADCALKGFVITLLIYIPIFVMGIFSEDDAHGFNLKKSLLGVTTIWIGAILILYAVHRIFDGLWPFG